MQAKTGTSAQQLLHWNTDAKYQSKATFAALDIHSFDSGFSRRALGWLQFNQSAPRNPAIGAGIGGNRRRRRCSRQTPTHSHQGWVRDVLYESRRSRVVGRSGL